MTFFGPLPEGKYRFARSCIAERRCKNSMAAFTATEAKTENVIPKGCIPTLPLAACQQLANTLRASWRTFDGFEEVDGELMRFTKGLLTSDEPDFETSLDDCRVSVSYTHLRAHET